MDLCVIHEYCVRRYAESAKTMIEKRGKSSESRKVVKWNAEDAMQWMRVNAHAKFEDYLVCA